MIATARLTAALSNGPGHQNTWGWFGQTKNRQEVIVGTKEEEGEKSEAESHCGSSSSTDEGEEGEEVDVDSLLWEAQVSSAQRSAISTFIYCTHYIHHPNGKTTHCGTSPPSLFLFLLLLLLLLRLLRLLFSGLLSDRMLCVRIFRWPSSTTTTTAQFRCSKKLRDMGQVLRV